MHIEERMNFESSGFISILNVVKKRSYATVQFENDSNDFSAC